MKTFNVNEREVIQKWNMKGDIIQWKCTEERESRWYENAERARKKRLEGGAIKVTRKNIPRVV